MSSLDSSLDDPIKHLQKLRKMGNTNTPNFSRTVWRKGFIGINKKVWREFIELPLWYRHIYICRENKELVCLQFVVCASLRSIWWINFQFLVYGIEDVLKTNTIFGVSSENMLLTIFTTNFFTIIALDTQTQSYQKQRLFLLYFYTRPQKILITIFTIQECCP